MTDWVPPKQRDGVDPEYVRQIHADAAEVAEHYPPLTQEQRARLSVLLRPQPVEGAA